MGVSFKEGVFKIRSMSMRRLPVEEQTDSGLLSSFRGVSWDPRKHGVGETDDFVLPGCHLSFTRQLLVLLVIRAAPEEASPAQPGAHELQKPRRT